MNKKEIKSKICKYCKIDQPIDCYGLSFEYKNKKYIKNICGECVKKRSHDYYYQNREKVLKYIESKLNKKKYNLIIRFTTLEDLEQEYNKLKEALINNELKETVRQKKKLKNDPNIINQVSNSEENIIVV